MKKRFTWGFVAGVLVGTIFLSEQSSFGDNAQATFSALRGFATAFLDNLAQASTQTGQFIEE